eukprot:CAMPEP_0167752038 /NCGR_PEP_ID=MMETSP0110_2-20121227/6911_1 /TAXON_ID=629695 /ORGANISM="Gymnochlora sp., Strain CCMP2014" /LENGTH=753 /DNA_ID=CAMNT_0007637599 /DNA_START=139 /DNA_END=2400 /DNA_ORIENTATION=-
MDGVKMDQKAKSSVEIKVSCRNLTSKDLFSKSDPVVICYENIRGHGWREVGRTELLWNKHNPDFKTKIKMPYYFEKQQDLKFEVWDWDNPKTKSTIGQDFIGYIEVSLATAVVETGMPRKLMKRGGRRIACKGKGRLILRVEEIKGDNEKLYMKLSGIKLPKMDFGFFAKSDPYFQVLRQEGKEWIKVYESEVKKRTLDPRWNPVTLTLRQLCNGDRNRNIRFKVYDHDTVGSHDKIGEFQCRIDELTKGKRFPLKRPKKKKDKTYGYIELSEALRYKDPTFLDYVRGGMDVSVMYAIDYTGSNGDPNHPRSLHYMGTGHNPYTDAITKINNILSVYDKSQMIPAFGFGGKMRGGNVSHCFPVNGNPSKPEVKGTVGLLNAYRQSFQRVLLSGPTYFSGILQMVNAIVSSKSFHASKQEYTILVIITDGEINDMRHTIDNFVLLSKMPISVVIVGVGQANFSKMEKLDGDDAVLTSSRGVKCERDIVQFVPMRRFRNNPFGLTDETLAEIPDQLLKYAKKYKIQPMAFHEREWKDDVKTVIGSVMEPMSTMTIGPAPSSTYPAVDTKATGYSQQTQPQYAQQTAYPQQQPQQQQPQYVQQQTQYVQQPQYAQQASAVATAPIATAPIATAPMATAPAATVPVATQGAGWWQQGVQVQQTQVVQQPQYVQPAQQQQPIVTQVVQPQAQQGGGWWAQGAATQQVPVQYNTAQPVTQPVQGGAIIVQTTTAQPQTVPVQPQNSGAAWWSQPPPPGA